MPFTIAWQYLRFLERLPGHDDPLIKNRLSQAMKWIYRGIIATKDSGYVDIIIKDLMNYDDTTDWIYQLLDQHGRENNFVRIASKLLSKSSCKTWQTNQINMSLIGLADEETLSMESLSWLIVLPIQR